jgi:hypothetical protein
MAASASFKQQCPSCEAMVPIKDPSFIGRKIDCPKCKYRFVVEDPATDEDELEEAEEEATQAKGAKKGKDGGNGVTAKKPAGGKTTPAKKKKPGLKSRRDDDDDDDEAPAKKKKGGSSMTLILGIGLAAVAVLVMVVGVIYWATSGGGGGTRGGGGGGGGGGMTNNGGTGDEQPAVVQQTKPAGPALGDITNLLPNDAEAVRSFNVDRLLNSAVGKAVFQPDAGTNPGGFRFDAFQRVMSFPFADVNRVVWAAKHPGLPDISEFAVIRTTKAQNLAALTRTLGLVRDKKSPIESQDFYTVTAPLDSLSRYLLTDGQANKPLTFHLYDDYTLVFASPEAMQTFLTAKRQPKVLAQAEGGGNSPAGQTTSPPPGMTMPAGGGSGMPASGGSGMMGGGPMSGGAQPAAPPPSAGLPSYATIKPSLKAVLDAVEEGKPPVILSWAVDPQAAVSILKQQDQLPKELGELRTLQQNAANVDAVGMSLQEMTTTRLAALYGVEMKKEDDARKGRDLLKLVAAPAALKALHDGMNLNIGLKPEETPAGPGPMMQSGYPNMSQPGVGGSSGQPMPMPMPMMRPGVGGSSGQPMPMPGVAGQAGAEGGQPEPKEEPTSTLAIRAKDKILLIGFDLSFKDNLPAYEMVMRRAELTVLQLKGNVDMDGRSHVHDLAAAVKGYADKNGQFPRGTADRPAGAERAGLPWRPDQRVSWLAEVVPLLGQQEFADAVRRVERDKSWSEDENLLVAQTLIPHFLAHDYPPTTWWGIYPGAPVPVAMTDFVGVGGIGDDAAEYSASDPSVAKKLGVFGYDRVTTLADIKDGPDKTIAVIQVPADYRTPWLAGGGSTIRGVPEEKSVQPFVCTTYNSQRGTFAIMADGKVRFIPETIADKDFQALCTIAGGETVDVDKVAPVVPGGEVPSVLKTQAEPPPVPSTPAPMTTTPPPPTSTSPMPATGEKTGDKPASPAPGNNTQLTPEQKKAAEQAIKDEKKREEEADKAGRKLAEDVAKEAQKMKAKNKP